MIAMLSNLFDSKKMQAHHWSKNKNRVDNQVPHCVTWMEDSRSGKLVPGVKCDVESNVQVENTHFAHLQPKASMTNERINITIFFITNWHLEDLSTRSGVCACCVYVCA